MKQELVDQLQSELDGLQEQQRDVVSKVSCYLC